MNKTMKNYLFAKNIKVAIWFGTNNYVKILLMHLKMDLNIMDN